MEIKTFLKWVGIPFGSVAAALFMHIVLTLAMGASSRFFNVDIMNYLFVLIRDFAVGGAFVTVGANIAPSGHRVVAIILTIALSIICTISFILATQLPTSTVLQYLGLFASLAGGIMAVFKIT